MQHTLYLPLLFLVTAHPALQPEHRVSECNYQCIWDVFMKQSFERANIFEEKNGIVAVEAEHFSEQTATAVRKWYLHTADKSTSVAPDPDDNHTGSASGKAYLEILPDTRTTHDDELIRSENFTNEPGEIGVLTYSVYFNTPGKYYVWVRAYSTGTEDNGIHVGIDGSWPESGQRMQWCDGKNTWTWDSKKRTVANHCGEPGEIYLEVTTAGEHTIHFSMREDGFEFDKWMMSLTYEQPDGLGADEVIKHNK